MLTNISMYLTNISMSLDLHFLSMRQQVTKADNLQFAIGLHESRYLVKMQYALSIKD